MYISSSSVKFFLCPVIPCLPPAPAKKKSGFGISRHFHLKISKDLGQYFLQKRQ